jgi:hypothetical protein
MDPSRADLSVADAALVMRARNGDHEAFGVHVGTVKTQLHRAVHRLRQELGAYR